MFLFTELLSNLTMQSYSINVAIRKISSMIWRRLKIGGDTSISAHHNIIQIAMGWDNYNLHQFRIYGKNYGISYHDGLSFKDNANSVHINQIEFDIGDKLTYEYNFYESRLCDVRIGKGHQSPTGKAKELSNE